MAKQSFKDIIFKLLRKDENLGAYGGVKQNKPKSFKVKFAMKDKPNNIAVMSYQFEKDAEKFKKDILAKGGKAIVLHKEDAPANATGTAVAGTGDDSSTVVVKKKKRLQDKLMRRMGIQETIDRVIPDLEYPKDEIRERVNQLKASALGETPQGYALVQKAKDIAKKMSGNMNAAVKEIEKLEKGLSNNSSVKDALRKANEELSEGERALARDKKTDQPKKYVSGLSDKDKKSHDRHLEKQGKKSDR